ncbi:MAG TPA: DMT family transporter [Gammaproteobacteria bacterium]|nr:DMT family transporter [Gammaproteobacteria bacterium]
MGEQPASSGIGPADALLGAAMVTLFSGFTLASRAGLTGTLHPWDLAALRFGVGGVLLWPVLWRYGLANVALRHALALALTGGAGFATFAYAGFALAPAVHGAVLLHGTLPLTTYALARARGMRPHANAGLAAIALGIVALAGDGALRGTTAERLGDAALLLASFSWSAYGLLAARLALPPAHTASMVSVFSLLATLIAFAAFPGLRLSPAGWREWLLQAAWQGVLIGTLSTYLYTTALARLGPQRIAALAAAVPCVTTAGAMLFLGEAPSRLVLAGLALVSGGVYVALRRRRES